MTTLQIKREQTRRKNADVHTRAEDFVLAVGIGKYGAKHTSASCVNFKSYPLWLSQPAQELSGKV